MTFRGWVKSQVMLNWEGAWRKTQNMSLNRPGNSWGSHSCPLAIKLTSATLTQTQLRIWMQLPVPVTAKPWLNSQAKYIHFQSVL